MRLRYTTYLDSQIELLKVYTPTIDILSVDPLQETGATGLVHRGADSPCRTGGTESLPRRFVTDSPAQTVRSREAAIKEPGRNIKAAPSPEHFFARRTERFGKLGVAARCSKRGLHEYIAGNGGLRIKIPLYIYHDMLVGTSGQDSQFTLRGAVTIATNCGVGRITNGHICGEVDCGPRTHRWWW